MENINYGKIENEKLIYAKNPLWVGNKMIGNPTAQDYENNGFKPVIYSEMPIKEGCYYTATYTDDGTVIKQGWKEHELPQDTENKAE